MTEGREGAEQQTEEQGAQAPFDDNPPVEPDTKQVGNSRARFFMPSEGGDEEVQGGEEEGEDGEEEEE